MMPRVHECLSVRHMVSPNLVGDTSECGMQF